jgi:hypothetical protein
MLLGIPRLSVLFLNCSVRTDNWWCDLPRFLAVWPCCGAKGPEWLSSELIGRPHRVAVIAGDAEKCATLRSVQHVSSFLSKCHCRYIFSACLKPTADSSKCSLPWLGLS